MGRLLFQRARHTVVLMFLASIVIFAVLRLIPGDPANSYVGEDASPEVIEAVTERMGLDRPLPVQYAIWIGYAARGDLGTSYRSGIEVGTLIARTFPATLELALAGVVLAALVGLTTGIIAALRPRGVVDSVITTTNSIVLGVPGFWLGILLVLVFALWLGWLPSGGRVSVLEDPLRGLRSLLLPAIAVSANTMAIWSRFMRGSLLGTLDDDYVRTAIAKGLTYRQVVVRHALRNAMIPVITIMGVSFGGMLGGAVVIEAVFAWPGVGRLIVQSLSFRDYLVVQGLFLMLVLTYLTVNFLVDICYGLLDPRIRASSQVDA